MHSQCIYISAALPARPTPSPCGVHMTILYICISACIFDVHPLDASGTTHVPCVRTQPDIPGPGPLLQSGSEVLWGDSLRCQHSRFLGEPLCFKDVLPQAEGL